MTAGPLGAWEFQPQLGLAYLCSYLKENGYPDTQYFDTSATPISQLETYFRLEQPDLVCVSIYTPTRHESFKVIHLAKKTVSQAKIVVGGVHPTFLPEQMIEAYPAIDYVVVGEGEEATLELVRAIESGSTVENIVGLCYRGLDGKAVRVLGHRPMTDIGSLPFPQYFEHFAKIDGRRVKAGSMITSRGCAAACNFCTVPAFWGRQRLRSPESVVAEMKWLVETHGVEYIWFMDDTFTIEMDEARKLLQVIINSGLSNKVRWRCATRVNCVSRDLLHLMKKAGCHRISYGVESGSPEILKTVMKGTRLEQAEAACLMAKEEGILVETNFMVGNPGETQETIDETKAFIKKVRPDEFNVSNALYLFPGTPSYNMAKRQNLIADEVWLTDTQTVAYTAENSQEQLSAWQIEIIRECGRHLGFLNNVKYFLFIIRRIPLHRIIKSVRHWLTVYFKRLSGFGATSRNAAAVYDLQELRNILREESIKARKKDQLKPLKAVRKLEGMALERFQ